MIVYCTSQIPNYNLIMFYVDILTLMIFKLSLKNIKCQILFTNSGNYT